MTKQDILDRFRDINEAYNDSSRYDSLSRMLDELLKEHEAPSKEELIAHYGKMYKCRRCGLEWYQQTQKYCQECGTAVKWE